METTRLSSKGQVIIPKAIRAAHRWRPGVTFAVEDTAEGILLRPLSPFPETAIEDVVGATGYHGPRRSIEEMNEAVARGAREGRR
jgi:AbrB family looped-hinge helix DNA binding protein